MSIHLQDKVFAPVCVSLVNFSFLKEAEIKKQREEQKLLFWDSFSCIKYSLQDNTLIMKLKLQRKLGILKFVSFFISNVKLILLLCNILGSKYRNRIKY